MNLKRSRREMVKLGVVACLLLSLLFVGLQPAFGQGSAAVDSEEPPMPPDEPHIPGTLEGTGTYFELTDSEYVNVTLESTEPVHLVLESVPEMIVMHLEPVAEVTSTVISLSGFPASTTYYKYEDDYHNEVSFTTDAAGGYTYTQDLTEPHLIFIQPRAGTKYIPSDTTIGTWDPVARTYTLTTDVYETVSVVQDNLTLDGNGHTITGTGSSVGVHLYDRTGVTIKNLNVEAFVVGFGLYYSSGNTLTSNTAGSNTYGIYLPFSSNNTLAGNAATSNSYCGIYLPFSHYNTLTGNTATANNYFGISLYSSSGNSLTGNTADSNKYYGIYLQYSGNNTLTGNAATANNYHGIHLWNSSNDNTVTGNTATANDYFGISLWNSSNNTLTGNTATSNNYYGVSIFLSGGNTLTDNTASNNGFGIYLYSSSSSQVYNNNFINNTVQAYVDGGVGNVFNMDKPVGGNYWSNWTSPDADGDGFVDSPYVFSGGQDNLPWARQDGWKIIPVDIDIKPGSHPNCFNVNGHGVIPVAILGSAEFDVAQIDVSTVSFAGLEVRVKGNDNPQCSVEDVSGDFTSPEGAPDGWADLVCQFVDDPTLWCPGDSTATLDGSLLDGTAFAASDEICIRPPEPELIVDQENDPVPHTSVGCGDTGLSLYQSFTPAASPLAAVQLRLRAGASFPEAGTNTTINIRSGDPTGAVLATATAFVLGPQEGGTQLLVDFGFSLPVRPGNTLVIEWLSVAGPGQPSDAILTWTGRTDNPYPGGNMFGCTGAPYPDWDLNFRTFTQ